MNYNELNQMNIDVRNEKLAKTAAIDNADKLVLWVKKNHINYIDRRN